MPHYKISQEEMEEMIEKFKDSPVESPGMVPLMIGLTAVSMFFVALRLFTRHVILQSIGWDDIIMVPAAAIGLTYTIIACKMPDFGWGHHIYDIPMNRDFLRNSYYYTFIVQMCFVVTITLVKISILFFYLRMSQVISAPSFRIGIFIVMAYSVCWGISTFTMVFLQCTPVHNFWTTDLELRRRTCRDWSDSKPTWLYAQGITNMAGDVMVLVLPMKVVCGLTIPLREKLGLALLFGLGLLACISELLRVIFAARIYESEDVTWKGFQGFALGIIEVHVGIMCASIPATKPFWAALFSYIKTVTLSGLNLNKDLATMNKSWGTNTTTTGTGTHNDNNGPRVSKRYSSREQTGPNDVNEIVRYDSYPRREERYTPEVDRYGDDLRFGDDSGGYRTGKVEQSRHIMNIQEFEMGLRAEGGVKDKETT